MDVARRSRKAPRTAAVLWIGVVLAAVAALAGLGTAGATQQLSLGGTWSGSYSGTPSGTFTLKWTQTWTLLKGSIKLSTPSGTYPIGGHVNGSSITFGAVGVGAVYSGTAAASGLSMSGTWKSGPAKGSWQAHKLLTSAGTKIKKP